MVELLVISNHDHASHSKELLNSLLRYKLTFTFAFCYDDVNIFEKYDGVILTGGNAPFYESVIEWYRRLLQNNYAPVLGICRGHQLLNALYGGEVKKMEKPEAGKTLVHFHKEFPLAPGITSLIVINSHTNEISRLSEEFENYASSGLCIYQAIKHKKKDYFGVQWHPELSRNDPILPNFIKCVKR